MNIRQATVAMAVGALAFAATGCASQSDAAGSGDIVIAFASNESSVIQAGDGRKAVEAAVQWVNEEKGGVGGRKIKLETCEAKGTPESNSTCANRLVGKKPAALIIQGVTDETAYVNATKASGIPVFVGKGTGPTLTNNHTFSLNAGSTGLLAAVAAYTEEQGRKNVGLLVTDVPAARGPAENAVKYYEKAGLSVVPVYAPPASADMTPSLSSAISRKVDTMFTTLDPATCISALKAKKTLDFKGTYVQSGACYTKDVITAGGDALDGVLVPMDLAVIDDSDDQDADVKLYKQIMSEYAPDADATRDHARSAMASFMLLYNGVLAKLPAGEVTAKAVLDATRKTTDEPIFLGKGAKANCDGKLAAEVVGACSASYLLYKSDKGSLSYVQTMDAGSLLR